LFQNQTPTRDTNAQNGSDVTTKSQTTTTATALPASRIGGGGGDVLDTTNLHAGTGEGTESGLSTGAGGLGTGTCYSFELAILIHIFAPVLSILRDRGKHTTSGSDLNVEGSDAELLAAGSDVLGSQHGSVGGGLVTIGLDLHTTGDSADGFTATGITHVSL